MNGWHIDENLDLQIGNKPLANFTFQLEKGGFKGDQVTVETAFDGAETQIRLMATVDLSLRPEKVADFIEDFSSKILKIKDPDARFIAKGGLINGEPVLFVGLGVRWIDDWTSARYPELPGMDNAGTIVGEMPRIGTYDDLIDHEHTLAVDKTIPLMDRAERESFISQRATIRLLGERNEEVKDLELKWILSQLQSENLLETYESDAAQTAKSHLLTVSYAVDFLLEHGEVEKAAGLLDLYLQRLTGLRRAYPQEKNKFRGFEYVLDFGGQVPALPEAAKVHSFANIRFALSVLNYTEKTGDRRFEVLFNGLLGGPVFKKGKLEGFDSGILAMLRDVDEDTVAVSLSPEADILRTEDQILLVALLRRAIDFYSYGEFKNTETVKAYREIEVKLRNYLRGYAFNREKGFITEARLEVETKKKLIGERIIRQLYTRSFSSTRTQALALSVFGVEGLQVEFGLGAYLLDDIDNRNSHYEFYIGSGSVRQLKNFILGSCVSMDEQKLGEQVLAWFKNHAKGLDNKPLLKELEEFIANYLRDHNGQGMDSVAQTVYRAMAQNKVRVDFVHPNSREKSTLGLFDAVSNSSQVRKNGEQVGSITDTTYVIEALKILASYYKEKDPVRYQEVIREIEDLLADIEKTAYVRSTGKSYPQTTSANSVVNSGDGRTVLLGRHAQSVTATSLVGLAANGVNEVTGEINGVTNGRTQDELSKEANVMEERLKDARLVSGELPESLWVEGYILVRQGDSWARQELDEPTFRNLFSRENKRRLKDLTSEERESLIIPAGVPDYAVVEEQRIIVPSLLFVAGTDSIQIESAALQEYGIGYYFDRVDSYILTAEDEKYLLTPYAYLEDKILKPQVDAIFGALNLRYATAEEVKAYIDTLAEQKRKEANEYMQGLPAKDKPKAYVALTDPAHKEPIILPSKSVILPLGEGRLPLGVKLGSRLLEKKRQGLLSYGFAYQYGETPVSVTQEDLQKAVVEGALITEKIKVKEGGEETEKEILKINGRVYEPGLLAIAQLKALREKHFAVPGSVQYMDEKQLVEAIRQGKIEVSAKMINGKLVLTNARNGKPIDVPSEVLERELAFWQGTLSSNGESVIALLRKPDFDRGLISTQITDPQELLKLRAAQVHDKNKGYLWWRDRNYDRKKDPDEEKYFAFTEDDTESVIKGEISKNEEEPQNAEEALLFGWRPVLSTNTDYNAEGYQAAGQIYQENLLLARVSTDDKQIKKVQEALLRNIFAFASAVYAQVKADGRLDGEKTKGAFDIALNNFNDSFRMLTERMYWVPNEALKDSDMREQLAREIYDGATLMRFNTTFESFGQACEYWYPSRDFNKMYVLDLTVGKVFSIPDEGAISDKGRRVFMHDSIDSGVHVIVYQSGSETRMKWFKLWEHNRDATPVYYIGTNAWGKVIVEPYMDEVVIDGKIQKRVKSVKVRLDENASVLGADLLQKLGLSGDEPVDRIYRNFDNNFNLTEQLGWAIKAREDIVIPETNERISVIWEVNMQGDVARIYAIDASGKETLTPEEREALKENLKKTEKRQRELAIEFIARVFESGSIYRGMTISQKKLSGSEELAGFEKALRDWLRNPRAFGVTPEDLAVFDPTILPASRTYRERRVVDFQRKQLQDKINDDKKAEEVSIPTVDTETEALKGSEELLKIKLEEFLGLLFESRMREQNMLDESAKILLQIPAAQRNPSQQQAVDKMINEFMVTHFANERRLVELLFTQPNHLNADLVKERERLIQEMSERISAPVYNTEIKEKWQRILGIWEEVRKAREKLFTLRGDFAPEGEKEKDSLNEQLGGKLNVVNGEIDRAIRRALLTGETELADLLTRWKKAVNDKYTEHGNAAYYTEKYNIADEDAREFEKDRREIERIRRIGAEEKTQTEALPALLDLSNYLTVAREVAKKWADALNEIVTRKEAQQSEIEQAIDVRSVASPVAQAEWQQLKKLEKDLYEKVKEQSKDSAVLKTRRERLQANEVLQRTDLEMRKIVRSVYRDIYGLAQPANSDEADKDAKAGLAIEPGLGNKLAERVKAQGQNFRTLSETGSQNNRPSLQQRLENWLNYPSNYWTNAALGGGTGLIGSSEGRAKVYTEDMASFIQDYLVNGRTLEEIDREKITQILDFYMHKAAFQIATTGKFNGLFNMYWAASGTLGEDVIFISSNAHILESVIAYTALTQDYSYMPLAESIIDYFESLRDTREGASGLFKHAGIKERVEYEGSKDGNGRLKERGKLVFDQLHALRALYTYRDLITAENTRINTLITSMETWLAQEALFDKESGYFYVGYDDEGKLERGLHVPTQTAAYELYGEKAFSCISASVKYALMRQKVTEYDPPVGSNPNLRALLRQLNEREEAGFGFGVHWDKDNNKLMAPQGVISRKITADIAYILAEHARETKDSAYEGLRYVLTEGLRQAVIDSAVAPSASGLSALSASGEDYFESYHQEVIPRLISLAPTATFYKLITTPEAAEVDKAQIATWQEELDRLPLTVLKVNAPQIPEPEKAKPAETKQTEDATSPKSENKTPETQPGNTESKNEGEKDKNAVVIANPINLRMAAAASMAYGIRAPPLKIILIGLGIIAAIVIAVALWRRFSRPRQNAQAPQQQPADANQAQGQPDQQQPQAQAQPQQPQAQPQAQSQTAQPRRSNITRSIFNFAALIIRVALFFGIIAILFGLPLYYNHYTLYDLLNPVLVKLGYNIPSNLSFGWKFLISVAVVELVTIIFGAIRPKEKFYTIEPNYPPNISEQLQAILSTSQTDLKTTQEFLIHLDRMLVQGAGVAAISAEIDRWQNIVDALYHVRKAVLEGKANDFDTILNGLEDTSTLKYKPPFPPIGPNPVKHIQSPDFNNLSDEAKDALNSIFEPKGRRGTRWNLLRYYPFEPVNTFFHLVNLGEIEPNLSNFIIFSRAFVEGKISGCISYWLPHLVPLYIGVFLIAGALQILFGDNSTVFNIAGVEVGLGFILFGITYLIRLAIPYIMPDFARRIREFWSGFFTTMVPFNNDPSDNGKQGKFIHRWLVLPLYLSYTPYLVWITLPWFYVHMLSLTNDFSLATVSITLLQLALGALYLGLVVILTYLPCFHIPEGFSAAYIGPGSMKRVFAGQAINIVILQVIFSSFGLSPQAYLVLLGLNLILHLSWLRGSLGRYFGIPIKIGISTWFTILTLGLTWVLNYLAPSLGLKSILPYLNLPVDAPLPLVAVLIVLIIVFEVIRVAFNRKFAPKSARSIRNEVIDKIIFFLITGIAFCLPKLSSVLPNVLQNMVTNFLNFTPKVALILLAGFALISGFNLLLIPLQIWQDKEMFRAPLIPEADVKRLKEVKLVDVLCTVVEIGYYDWEDFTVPFLTGDQLWNLINALDDKEREEAIEHIKNYIGGLVPGIDKGLSKKYPDIVKNIQGMSIEQLEHFIKQSIKNEEFSLEFIRDDGGVDKLKLRLAYMKIAKLDNTQLEQFMRKAILPQGIDWNLGQIRVFFDTCWPSPSNANKVGIFTKKFLSLFVIRENFFAQEIDRGKDIPEPRRRSRHLTLAEYDRYPIPELTILNHLFTEFRDEFDDDEELTRNGKGRNLDDYPVVKSAFGFRKNSPVSLYKEDGTTSIIPNEADKWRLLEWVNAHLQTIKASLNWASLRHKAFEDLGCPEAHQVFHIDNTGRPSLGQTLAQRLDSIDLSNLSAEDRSYIQDQANEYRSWGPRVKTSQEAESLNARIMTVQSNPTVLAKMKIGAVTNGIRAFVPDAKVAMFLDADSNGTQENAQVTPNVLYEFLQAKDKGRKLLFAHPVAKIFTMKHSATIKRGATAQWVWWNEVVPQETEINQHPGFYGHNIYFNLEACYAGSAFEHDQVSEDTAMSNTMAAMFPEDYSIVLYYQVVEEGFENTPDQYAVPNQKWAAGGQDMIRGKGWSGTDFLIPEDILANPDSQFVTQRVKLPGLINNTNIPWYKKVRRNEQVIFYLTNGILAIVTTFLLPFINFSDANPFGLMPFMPVMLILYLILSQSISSYLYSRQIKEKGLFFGTAWIIFYWLPTAIFFFAGVQIPVLCTGIIMGWFGKAAFVVSGKGHGLLSLPSSIVNATFGWSVPFGRFMLALLAFAAVWRGFEIVSLISYIFACTMAFSMILGPHLYNTTPGFNYKIPLLPSPSGKGWISLRKENLACVLGGLICPVVIIASVFILSYLGFSEISLAILGLWTFYSLIVAGFTVPLIIFGVALGVPYLLSSIHVNTNIPSWSIGISLIVIWAAVSFVGLFSGRFPKPIKKALDRFNNVCPPSLTTSAKKSSVLKFNTLTKKAFITVSLLVLLILSIPIANTALWFRGGVERDRATAALKINEFTQEKIHTLASEFPRSLDRAGTSFVNLAAMDAKADGLKKDANTYKVILENPVAAQPASAPAAEVKQVESAQSQPASVPQSPQSAPAAQEVKAGQKVDKKLLAIIGGIAVALVLGGLRLRKLIKVRRASARRIQERASQQQPQAPPTEQAQTQTPQAQPQAAPQQARPGSGTLVSLIGLISLIPFMGGWTTATPVSLGTILIIIGIATVITTGIMTYHRITNADRNRLLAKLREKGMPTKVMKKEAWPVALKAVKHNIARNQRKEARRLVAELGANLADKGILPCATIQYGITLAIQSSAGDLNQFRNNLVALKAIATRLHPISTFVTFKFAKSIIVKLLNQGVCFEDSLRIGEVVAPFYKKIIIKGYAVDKIDRLVISMVGLRLGIDDLQTIITLENEALSKGWESDFAVEYSEQFYIDQATSYNSGYPGDETGNYDPYSDPSVAKVLEAEGETHCVGGIQGFYATTIEYTILRKRKYYIPKLEGFIHSLTPANAAQRIRELALQQQAQGPTAATPTFPATAKKVDLPQVNLKVKIGMSWNNLTLEVSDETAPLTKTEKLDVEAALAEELTQQMARDRDRFLTWLGKNRSKDIDIIIHGAEGPLANAGRRLDIEAGTERNEIYLSWLTLRAPPETYDTPDHPSRTPREILRLVISDEVDHLLHPEDNNAVVHRRLALRVIQKSYLKFPEAIEYLVTRKDIQLEEDFVKSIDGLKSIHNRLSQVRAHEGFAVCFAAMEMPLINKSGKRLAQNGGRGGGQGVYMRDVPYNVSQNGLASFVVSPLFFHDVLNGCGNLNAFLAAFDARILMDIEVPVGSGKLPLKVIYVEQEGVPVLLLYDETGHLFTELYRFGDIYCAGQFPGDTICSYVEAIVLPRAALIIQEELGIQFEIFHFNDWQTALGPVFLKELYQNAQWPLGRRPAAFFTTHNLEYQGVFDGYVKVAREDWFVKYLFERGALKMYDNAYNGDWYGQVEVDMFKLTNLRMELRNREGNEG
ncbi:MAG: glycogen/starch synthase, partial [Bacteroidales bacterium]